jgi:hypothetical protein
MLTLPTRILHLLPKIGAGIPGVLLSADITSRLVIEDLASNAI